VAEKIRGVAIPHLKAWRIAHTLSQTELAEQAHVSRATITRAERGEIVSFPNVRAIAKVLDLTVAQMQREPPADR